MTAYFENGVFTKATPAWHGLGTVIEDQAITAERVFELVPELGSDIVRAPIFAAYGDEDDPSISETDRYLANVRVLDGRIVGVMGSRYELFTGRDMFAFGDEVVGQVGGAHYNTAGTLKGGSTIWGLVDLPGSIEIAGLPGERMTPYLFLANSFDGSCALQVRTAWTRVVCANTFNVALNQGLGFKIRHTANLGDRVVEAQQALGMTFQLGEEIKALGDKLIAEKVNRKAMNEFLATLVPFVDDATEAQKDNTLATRADIAHIFTDSPTTGDAAGTKWGALQAVMEYTQRYAGGSDEARMRKTLLSSPELNTRALAILTS